MRILEVMAGAAHGGAETAFVDMCIAFHEAGHSVAVATRPNDLRVGQLRSAGIIVHELPFGGALDFKTKRALKKIITMFRPDMVQTWMSRAAQKTPRWTASMNIPRYLVVSRLGGYYKTTHFKNTDYFTTITPDIRRFLIDEGIAGDKILHINNFAETEEGAQAVDRATLDTPADAFVFLALGRLHESKALDTLLEAVAQVPNIYLWIAGEGPDRAALEALRDRLGVQDRVRFLGWRDDRGALFMAADACVFPSRYEPFGTVFVQAWAQKRPVVTSLADGPRQYVRDGEDGLTFPVDDIARLAVALQRVAQESDLRKSLINNGYNRYLNEFTKAQTTQSYLAFFAAIRQRENLPPQI